ncbi:MAG: hypothetical protein GXP46_12235 [Deferribacteres bacterium]|nr:hypothetical protein [Deferribacteres bacterium]
MPNIRISGQIFFASLLSMAPYSSPDASPALIMSFLDIRIKYHDSGG